MIALRASMLTICPMEASSECLNLLPVQELIVLFKYWFKIWLIQLINQVVTFSMLKKCSIIWNWSCGLNPSAIRDVPPQRRTFALYYSSSSLKKLFRLKERKSLLQQRPLQRICSTLVYFLCKLSTGASLVVSTKLYFSLEKPLSANVTKQNMYYFAL